MLLEQVAPGVLARTGKELGVSVSPQSFGIPKGIVNAKKKKGPRMKISAATLRGYRHLFGGKIPPGAMAQIRREYAKVKNPSESAFDRCVRSVAAKGSADDPRAVCAVAGRKKYGKARFQAMAAAGRRKARKNPGRRNPQDAAQQAFQGTHGRASEETITITTPIHEHKWLTVMGELVKLEIRAESGRKVMLSEFGGTYLSFNEQRTQLFIEGGDQAVDVELFGIREPIHELEDLGELLRIWYYTTKDHLGDEGGEAVYHHTLKSHRFRRRPMVVYDTINRLLFLAGGNYKILDEGILD